MTINLATYLERVKVSGPLAPDLATLRKLTAAHARSIAFENLDPLLGVPVADLGADALAAKLVLRRRGGYCFEQNGLMGHVLEAVGFKVEPFLGRVRWGREPSAPVSAQTHQALAVTLPDAADRYLVDVGFGGPTPPEPLRFETDVEQKTSHESYRLLREGEGESKRKGEDKHEGEREGENKHTGKDERKGKGKHEGEHARKRKGEGEAYILQVRIRDEWRSIYRFFDRTPPPIDLEVSNWYVSTHPKSKFTTTLAAARVTDEGRLALSGRYLAEHRDGTTKRVRLEDAGEVLRVLDERFGIDTNDVTDRKSLEARINAVMGD